MTLSAVNDSLKEGEQIGILEHTGSSDDPAFDRVLDPSFLELSNFVLRDDDAGQLVIFETGGSTQVSEEGQTSDTYTVRLNSQPIGPVSVRIDKRFGGDPEGLTVSPSTLSFNSLNWSTPQSVTVTAISPPRCPTASSNHPRTGSPGHRRSDHGRAAAGTASGQSTLTSCTPARSCRPAAAC